MPVKDYTVDPTEATGEHPSDLSRLADISVDMRPYASESSDSEADVFAAADARKLRMLAAVDQTEELKDYVLTAMRQLSRMSSGLAMLLPTSSLRQGSHSTLDDTNPRGADLMGRVWHGLHKVSATVNSLARHATGGRDPYFEALDLSLLPPDPTMALEAIHAKLYSLRRKLDAPLRNVDVTARPLLMSAWEQGHQAAHEHTATAVSLWTSKAAELQTRVQAAMSDPTQPDTGASPLLHDVLDFLATMKLVHAPAVAASTARQAQAVNELVTALQSSLPAPSHDAADAPHRHAPSEQSTKTSHGPPASRRHPTPHSQPTPTKDRPTTAERSPQHSFLAEPKKRSWKDAASRDHPQQQPQHQEKKARRPSTSPYAAWTIAQKEKEAKKGDSAALPVTPTPTAQHPPASAVSPATSRRDRPPSFATSAAPDTPPPTTADDDALVPLPNAPMSRVIGCEKCLMNNNHDKMLLCDNDCGREYHMYCLNPELDVVPEDDWFCPECVKVSCLAVKCSRFCVFNERYCPRHLCKEKGCSYRCKKQGYCGKHSKLHGPHEASLPPPHAAASEPFDDDDSEYVASYN